MPYTRLDGCNWNRIDDSAQGIRDAGTQALRELQITVIRVVACEDDVEPERSIKSIRGLLYLREFSAKFSHS
jgi:hypothetical protein